MVCCNKACWKREYQIDQNHLGMNKRNSAKDVIYPWNTTWISFCWCRKVRICFPWLFRDRGEARMMTVSSGCSASKWCLSLIIQAVDRGGSSHCHGMDANELIPFPHERLIHNVKEHVFLMKGRQRVMINGHVFLIINYLYCVWCWWSLKNCKYLPYRFGSHSYVIP